MSNTRWDAPELAERYDRVSDSQFKKGKLLVEKMGIKSGDAVLDIGCGTGRLAMYMSSVVGPKGRVVGVDPSPHRIDVARKKLDNMVDGNVQFAIGSGESPGSLPEESFDHVCYSSVFHWVEDKPAALRAAYRLLKPGGKIGITTWDRENPSGVKSITYRLFTRPPYAGRVRADEDASKPVTRKELETLLPEAGFTEIGININSSVRHYSSPEEVFAFNEASSFGSFLKHVPEDLLSQARCDIAEELEKRRTPEGIGLETSTIYAIARKPA